MSDRREPVISGIRPEKDEIARHSQRAGGPPGGRPPMNSRPPIIVKSRLAPFAFLLAILGIGLAGYAFWQLTLTQQKFALADARLIDLEGRMTLSDDESTQSVEVLQARLKEAEQEVRKLWDTRNVNKNAVAENKSALAKVSKTANSLEGKLQGKLNSAVADVKLMNELVEAQQGAMDSIDRKYQQQLAQIQNLESSVAELEAVRTELQRRVQTNEQAIEAIDSFRLQVNRELLQLRGQ